MIPTTILLSVLLSQFSLAIQRTDYDTIKDHATTISQILLIQDKEKVYLKEYGPYLVALRFCESRFNDEAINQKDTDGTRSYYRYQFKPATFLKFGIEYGILPENTTLKEARGLIKDGDLQEEITVKMIKNNINLSKQFPACHRKFGWLLDKE